MCDFILLQAKTGAAAAPAPADATATSASVSTPFDNYKFRPIREATVSSNNGKSDPVVHIWLLYRPQRLDLLF